MKSILNKYISLLVDNEEWLMERILTYAKKYEFTKYASTLQEAWRLSISGLSESLTLAAKKFELEVPELHPDKTYTDDPVSLFGIIEARKHRQRGITISMFIGLMKYYRQSYIDLIHNEHFDDLTKNSFLNFTERCFDHMEIGYINEWTATPEQEILQELQDANRMIANEKNKYLTVFESFFAPTIILDDKNQIVNLNLASSKLFSSLKIAGELYYSSDSSQTLNEINDKLKSLLVSTEEELQFETYLDTNVGRRYFQVLLKKIMDVSEKFKGSIVMLHDLTQHKEFEERLQIAKVGAEESNRLKTTFLANMSHEIRTPMNAILGFTELMITTDTGKTERMEYLKLIRKSSSDLLNIIEDLIDFAKIESKQLKMKYHTCRPYDLINDLQSLFKEVLRRFGINDSVKLIARVEIKDRDLVFFCDTERLKQVLSNLLNNAAKFTDKGFIEFGYKIVNQNNLLFFVRDSGNGIPENMLSKIFDRFTQVEQEGMKNFRSSGLGLTISKNIIELLDGKIWVESELGKGSDFYFQIPIRQIPEDKSLQKNESIEQVLIPNIDWSSKIILIAEDDEINFQYLSEVLKSTQAKVIRAKNGLEAINMAESEEKLDLILMDIKMPEIDGYEASRYITSIRPEIPIIAQTAFALDGDKAKCLNAGCVAYITKPVEPQKLYLIMDKFLTQPKKAKEKTRFFH